MRRREQTGWLEERRSSGGGASHQRVDRRAQKRVGALVLVTLLTLCWGACADEDGSPSIVRTGDGGGARDGGGGGVGGSHVVDGGPDASDSDFGFEELDVPDDVDAGTDSSVPDRPDEFSCGAERWADGAHCDCGCVVADPDCAGREACSEADCEAAGCDVRHDETGAALRPESYSCEAATFDALDGCDCGCGAIDPDCIGDGCTEPGCKEDACARCRDDEGNPLACLFACDEDLLGDGPCDCGCGSADPDCDELGCSDPGCFADACQHCYGADGELSCERGACPVDFKLDGACDCGCRERDPDCLASESFCLEPSCSAPGCARCFDASGDDLLCEDWTCDIESESPGMSSPSDGCNCGCGAMDPDCAIGEGCAEPGCLADGCQTCRTEDGAPMSCMP
jgi:hypothetical protein